jgi:ABC-2 type transport system ATP-binding protein
MITSEMTTSSVGGDAETAATSPSETHFGIAVPVVQIEGVSKSYQEQMALNDVSLSIGRGEIFALLGPNGAGKTTLLRILTGILLPDTGTVRIMGASGMNAVRDQVGYLPEERGLYKKQKIREYLAYLGELKGLSRQQAKARTMVVLEQVGMAAHADSTADTLSKGMAQRIQIAAALVHDPPFIILDEPFSGLDPVSARQMQDIVRAEKAQGRTVLLSTHQMEPVERLCDRLLMLHRGRTVLYGTPQEARERFAEGIVRVEHGEASISDVLPEGFAVKNAVPHVTHLIPPPGMTPRDVMAALLAAGVDLRGFETVTPSLEDVFVRIVGEKG